jgi:hypothetical protein
MDLCYLLFVSVMVMYFHYDIEILVNQAFYNTENDHHLNLIENSMEHANLVSKLKYKHQASL